MTCYVQIVMHLIEIHWPLIYEYYEYIVEVLSRRMPVCVPKVNSKFRISFWTYELSKLKSYCRSYRNLWKLR